MTVFAENRQSLQLVKQLGWKGGTPNKYSDNVPGFSKSRKDSDSIDRGVVRCSIPW